MVMAANAVSAAWDVLYQHHVYLLRPFLDNPGTTPHSSKSLFRLLHCCLSIVFPSMLHKAKAVKPETCCLPGSWVVRCCTLWSNTVRHRIVIARRGKGCSFFAGLKSAAVHIKCQSCVLPVSPCFLMAAGMSCWHVMLACDAADTKKILIGALLSEYHDTTRTWCLRFLDHLAQLSSDAHQWVLQLLSDNMQEADCKPSYCLAYYSVFAVMISSLPKQNSLVRPYRHCSTVKFASALLLFDNTSEAFSLYPVTL